MVSSDDSAPSGTTAGPWGRRLVVLLLVSAAVVGADQVTKRVVASRVRGRLVTVMPGFDLRYARNPGAAWGLLADTRETYRRPFFIGVSVAAMGFILYTYARAGRHQTRLRLALALILGGAVGNFLDRITLGYVIDFVDWHARLFGRVRHWPTFNVADAGITVGVLLLALELFPRRRARAAADDRALAEPAPAAVAAASGDAPPVPPAPPAPPAP